MPRGELHVQLYIYYADDEKFEEVSRSSRLLYVDSLLSAKKLLNDGVFSAAQIHKLMYPESKRAATKAAAELVAAGLWTWNETTQRFTIAAWLKRNKSRQQIEQDRRDAEEAAALGNHKRWHEARNQRDEKCTYCRDTPQPPPSGTRSPTRSGGGQRVLSPETETETETEKYLGGRALPQPPPREAPASHDGEPGPAERLVTEWVNACTRRPPSSVVNPVGQHVAVLLRDGCPPADIRRALEIWQAKGLHPNVLPSVVNQVMNATTSNVVAIANHRPTTDQRAQQALDIGAQLQAEHDRKALER